MSIWIWVIAALVAIMAVGNLVMCMPDKWPRNRRGRDEKRKGS